MGQEEVGERIPVGQKVETPVIELYLGVDGIVYQRSKQVDDYSVAHAREHIALLGRVTGGKKLPILTDIRGITNTGGGDLRHYYASPEGSRYYAALAIVVDSMITRVISNFYFNVARPPYPSRMFTDEALAVEWLKQYVPADWSSDGS